VTPRGGVEVEDIVDFCVPYGAPGRLAHTLVVRRQTQGIFAFRARRTARLFPHYGPAPGDRAVLR
jgi:hypothetical protein